VREGNLVQVCDILKPQAIGDTFITYLWRTLETTSGVTEPSLDDASIRELNLLAQHAKCSLLQDKAYGLLGLFLSSTSSAVTIDYSRETAEVLAELLFRGPRLELQLEYEV